MVNWEHNWLTGSIIGSWELMLYYDTCVLDYIGCVERTGVVVVWWWCCSGSWELCIGRFEGFPFLYSINIRRFEDGGPMLASRWFLIQLSSASAERIFSLLTNSSNERQNS